jgi:molybdate transport system substrate-binding protein
MKIIFSIAALCLMLQSSALFAADPAGTKVTITIAAAASLENTVKKLIPQFQKKYPNITVVGTYGGSGALQTQIEQGLDADVFFSAATSQMDNLVKSKFVNAADVKKLLQNKLVLIKGKKTKTTVTGFENITTAKREIALGDLTAKVPVGVYAKEAFDKLGNWSAVQAANPSFGTDVTQVLNWVAQGNAEVGVVYATDAASNKNVVVIASLADGVLAAPIIYPVSVTAKSAHKAEAQQFVDYLASPEGIAVFKQFGFSENK